MPPRHRCHTVRCHAVHPRRHPSQPPNRPPRPSPQSTGKGASSRRRARKGGFDPAVGEGDFDPLRSCGQARSTKKHEARSTKHEATTCARRWTKDDPSSRSTTHVLLSGRNESTDIPPRRTNGLSKPSVVRSKRHARVRIRRRVERRDGSVFPRDAPSFQAAVVVDPHTIARTFARRLSQAKTKTKGEARTQARSTSSWPHERGFVAHVGWRNASLRTDGRSTWSTACVETTVRASKCFVRVCSRPFQDGSSCWKTRTRLPGSAHSKCRSTLAKKERRCGPSC